MKRIVWSACAVLLLSGCYHATILTGLPAGTEKIEQKWASSFVYGIVPPATVETMQKCPNGVSRVDTQHSFLNGLVASLTWGIYTPIEITVTCAAPRSGEEAPMATNAKEFEEKLESGKPFYVKL